MVDWESDLKVRIVVRRESRWAESLYYQTVSFYAIPIIMPSHALDELHVEKGEHIHLVAVLDR